MKIAYIHNDSFLRNIAGYQIAYSFKHEFEKINNDFRIFNIGGNFRLFRSLRKDLLDYCPDLIMTSTNLLEYVSLEGLPATKLLLWGDFYSDFNYEKQCISISNKNKKLLSNLQTKHNIIVWAQHSQNIIDEFYAGYEKELSIPVIQLMHAASDKDFVQPRLDPDFDLIWIGKTSHRKELYNAFIKGLSQQCNMLEITEKKPVTPEEIRRKELYSRSLIGINLHTSAQCDFKMLLNERVFVSIAQGTLHVTNNLLYHDVFSNFETDILETQDDLLDAVEFYRKNLDLRYQKVRRLQEYVRENHTYTQRVKKILESFDLIND